MRYLSTRGRMPAKTFSEILLEGLAPDGGLAVPDHYPEVTLAQLSSWQAMDYAGLAFEILRQFADDLPNADLRDIVARTYTKEAFGTADITPVRTPSPGLHILGCSNGPSLAFKDVALQLLGNLFEYVLAKSGRELNILGATSGDTGSSAEYAMRGKRGIRVFMLSPHGRMSAFQTAQMFSLQDPNIFNIAVRGVFDDCQDMVKAVSADAEFKTRQKIGTVNSINWARVCAQTVYYFWAYLRVAKRIGEPVSFAVPSGNFGNVYAGCLAKKMGLPVRRLILATNENNVLDEFFRTGIYRVRRTDQVIATSSPSMDISKASNFERYIYDVVGCDPKVTADLWRQLETSGEFDLNGTPYLDAVRASGFTSGSSTHGDRLNMIRWMYRSFGEIVDTHTADGIKVGMEQREAGVPLICLETALPVKFSATIQEALGIEAPRPAKFEGIEALPQRSTVMDPDVDAIKRFVAAHTGL